MERRIADVVQTLERAGLHDVATEVSHQLGDPVEQQELEAFLESYGVTLNVLISRMGGSP